MNLSTLVEKVSEELLKQNKMMVAAESCTGGLIAKSMTDRAGSSSVFERGFVTYSNEAKQELLGVNSDTLEAFGAVSLQTALEMAKGALKNSHGQIAVSVTGIAGPGGGTDEKPVGLVYIAIAYKDKSEAFECHFKGPSREEIREQTAKRALEIILDHITR